MVRCLQAEERGVRWEHWENQKERRRKAMAWRIRRPLSQGLLVFNRVRRLNAESGKTSSDRD